MEAVKEAKLMEVFLIRGLALGPKKKKSELIPSLRHHPSGPYSGGTPKAIVYSKHKYCGVIHEDKFSGE